MTTAKTLSALLTIFHNQKKVVSSFRSVSENGIFYQSFNPFLSNRLCETTWANAISSCGYVATVSAKANGCMIFKK